MTLQDKARYDNILSIAHHKYQKGLYRYSLFKIHNKSLSEDLVQDTFIKTWAYLAKGGEILFMKAFLYRILNNLIIDEYRKRKTTSLDTLIEVGFDPSSDSLENLYDLADGKRALELIKLLPQKYQTVMNMRFVDNLSTAEISAITKQSKNTITVQMHRGLEKIKSLYAEKMQAFLPTGMAL